MRERLAGNGRVVATAPTVPVAIGDDLDALRRLERGWSALYLGGMGGFYAAAAMAMGFGAMVETVRERYADDRSAAKAAVTDDYIDAIGLFGPAERIRERAGRYAGADELVLELRKPDLADQLQDLKLLRTALGEVLG